MFLGHLFRALFRPHFLMPAFIRHAFQYLAFVCFDNGYKYIPTATVFIAGIRNFLFSPVFVSKLRP